MADKTIGVSETTHKRLQEYCGKGRTYDEAINNLLDISDNWDRLSEVMRKGDLTEMSKEENRLLREWGQDGK